MKPAAANILWWASCVPSALAFRQALTNPEKAQREVLNGILRELEGSEQAEHLGMPVGLSAEEFRNRCPVSSYEDYKPAIERMLIGGENILTRKRPDCFEPSSGSSSACKFIPCTKKLRREMQAAITPWIFNLFRQHPKAARGKAYWAITPPAAAVEAFTQTQSNAPRIGFENDSEYLGPFARIMAEVVLAVPASVAKVKDIPSSQYLTLAFLLGSPDLSLISVWSPSFLTLLLDELDKNKELLLRDLFDGILRPPRLDSTDIPLSLSSTFKAQKSRARKLDKILAVNISPRKIWPSLTLVSCWADAASKTPAAALASRMPDIALQPKGLLATEGIVSFPFTADGLSGNVLALRSHFLEFEEEDRPGKIRFAWELEEGGCYSVLLTNGAGLCRYRLGDIIRVSGFLRACPIIEFLGRESIVSDLCGEKLHEAFAASTILELFAGKTPDFALLFPAPPSAGTPHYLLIATTSGKQHESRLDELLRRNFHYNLCRELGQLSTPRIIPLALSPEMAHQCYRAEMLARGLRSGTVKHTFLDKHSNWLEILHLDSGMELPSP